MIFPRLLYQTRRKKPLVYKWLSKSATHMDKPMAGGSDIFYSSWRAAYIPVQKSLTAAKEMTTSLNIWSHNWAESLGANESQTEFL